jgi:hypothetical protein
MYFIYLFIYLIFFNSRFLSCYCPPVLFLGTFTLYDEREEAIYHSDGRGFMTLDEKTAFIQKNRNGGS